MTPENEVWWNERYEAGFNAGLEARATQIETWQGEYQILEARAAHISKLLNDVAESVAFEHRRRPYVEVRIGIETWRAISDEYEGRKE